MLPEEQQQSLAWQLKEAYSFTSDFLKRLMRWSENSSAGFQTQGMSQLENASFDDNLSKLVDFLNQKGIPSDIGKPILLSFLCQPEVDLTVLYSLLENIAKDKKINDVHL